MFQIQSSKYTTHPKMQQKSHYKTMIFKFQNVEHNNKYNTKSNTQIPFSKLQTHNTSTTKIKIKTIKYHFQN